MRENMKDGSKTKKWNAMICQLLNNYFQSNLILVTFDGLNNGKSGLKAFCKSDDYF